MTAVPSREVTTSQVSAVTFGFYSEQEVRKLSVKRINSPYIFDNLKNAVSGGVYDPCMGPLEQRECCTTCGQKGACPGHFGHIELVLPVYNPLVFTTLYKLIRSTCLNCYQLKMAQREVDKYTAKLHLLAKGQLTEAAAVAVGGGKMADTAQQITDDGEEEGVGGNALKGKGLKGSPKRGPPLDDARVRSGVRTAHTQEAMRECINRFLKAMPAQTCANCHCHNPSLRRDGCAKIFQTPLAPNKLAANQMRGVDIKRAGPPSGADSAEAEQLEEEMAQKVAKEAEEKSKKSAEAEAEEGTPPAEGGQPSVTPAPPKRAAADSSSSGRYRYMHPSEVKEVLKRMWRNNTDILSLIYAVENKGVPHSHKIHTKYEDLYEMFFIQTVPVAPNKFRAPSKLGDQVFEHPQNTLLISIINANTQLLGFLKPEGEEAQAESTFEGLVRGYKTWLRLQDGVCALFDSSSTSQNQGTQGIRQILEKKEGLFRKNMMGKRVNFAARSVISPDPYLASGEIGVPPYFAKRLSFPERVTPWNVRELRQAVTNGPDKHPGAVAVEDEFGRVISLGTFSQQRRESVAKQLMSRASASGPLGRGGGNALPSGNGKIVYRHLKDGDLMLTNRQPTLHKPGLMAHRARVLWGERVIRMHYANCNTFNADFDGDEINLHLPQDNLARAEGYEIVHADEQYIVPTDGKPVRGLIQDHIVSGVWMTKRDTFLTRAEYMQLVYAACGPTRPGLLDAADHVILPPTIFKPELLYTGKQVITSVLAFYTRGKPPVTFTCLGKTPLDYFGRFSGESELYFYKGELLTGIMDKAQYGKFGLVHAVQELYGANVAGDLISALSRLFTAYLHIGGFTCGLDDLLIVDDSEKQRNALCDTAETRALRASAEFADVSMPGQQATQPEEERECRNAEPAVRAALSKMYRTGGAKTGVLHDMKATGAMHPISSEVIKVCLPRGQKKPFPHNCLSLMTVTGAKGSLVNFSQISCLLGQQELEGRRVPRMASGKTLPCFSPFDAGARSGGFIGDRFLTGLRPQEYYFHCMAGRDGLVDTTVKTSRSGYLQRCLVKNLESLKVNYDHTVRDDCDGSIVQFAYGEDGVDVMNVSYLWQFGFLSRNAERFSHQINLKQALQSSGLSQWEEEARTLTRKRQRQLIKAAKGKKAKPSKGGEVPVNGVYPLTCLGVTSEAFADALGTYVTTNPDESLQGGLKQNKKRKPDSIDPGLETVLDPTSPIGFQRLMELKYLRSLAAPGEAVGVIAAQSVGEPSTQMTLNTFHMAGRGEANVTLGIPRLRELFMTAAQSIKTPVMTLPMRPGMGNPQATELANRLRRIRLAEVLQGLSMEEQVAAPCQTVTYGMARLFRLKLQFYPEHLYPKELGVTFADVAKAFKTGFMPKLQTAVKAELKKVNAAAKVAQMSVANLGGEEQGAAAQEGSPEGDGTGTAARKSEKEDEDENEEQNEEYQEGKLRFAGGRNEQATYDAGDEEDKQIAAAARREAEKQGGEEEDEESLDASPDQTPDPTSTPTPPSSRPTPDTTPASGKGSGSKKKGGDKADNSLTSNDKVNAEDYSCEVEVVVPVDTPTLLMQEIAERVAVATMVKDTPGVDRCYIVEADANGPTKVQTDGINFPGVWVHSDIIDVDNITTNDVGSTLRMYGVEAARATLMREVRAVFGAYGIGVDPRHLGLIADFMTHTGGYRACNRMGIESSTSTFLKISFETAAHFLTDATMRGTTDDLTSPASRLVVGRVVEMGTGCFDLVQNLDMDFST